MIVHMARDQAADQVDAPPGAVATISAPSCPCRTRRRRRPPAHSLSPASGDDRASPAGASVRWRIVDDALRTIRATRSGGMREFDLIVIGAGVAGLTAAMHGSRSGLNVAVVERMGVGGQIAAAERIENVPGFPQGVSGAELGPLLHEQAEAAGAEFVLDTVESIAIDGDWRVVNGAADPLKARAVIVAAGSALLSLGVPGDETFMGRGVSHCASCDGHFFSGQEVCVIGGGDSALDEALVLTEHAARVAIIHRGAAFDAQRALIDRAANNVKIEIVPSTAVEEIVGADSGSGVRLRDLAAGTTHERAVKGVFVY